MIRKLISVGLPGQLILVVKIAVNLILIIFWIWLYRPVFQYLGSLFSREEFRTNFVLLIGIVGLIIYHVRGLPVRLRPGTMPQFYPPALGLAIGSSLAYLLSEKLLDINILAAFLFGLATYGLLGLWMPPVRWWQGFPAMLLVIGVLPFGEHIETFAGFPLRTFTAGLARSGLNSLGFHSVGVDTILVFESGISQVDIPCSGVKSLWTGMLFLLAATWIENRKLSLRWLVIAIVTVILLVGVNLVRVTALALVGPALGWTQLAKIIHLPLGVLGFSAVCISVIYLLRLVPQWHSFPSLGETVQASPGEILRPYWLSPLLLVGVVGMSLAYSPRFDPQSQQVASQPTWQFPDRLALQNMPLSAQEMNWIRQGGADTADRFSFSWNGLAGKPVDGVLMLLTSRTWRGQHRPERCFEVFGLGIEESYSVLLAPDFPVRALSLSNRISPEHVTAVYWLQSIKQTTDDFGKRIWSDLGSPQERWVLVTVLFDRTRDLKAQDLSGFFAAIHDPVEQSLAEGS